MEKRIQLFGGRQSVAARPVPSIGGAPLSPAPAVAPMPMPQDPSFAQLAENFTEAIAAWAKAGFPITSKEVAMDRRATCAQCPLWDPKARFGLGKCMSLKCGCTRVKVWLATSQCPERKWNE